MSEGVTPSSASSCQMRSIPSSSSAARARSPSARGTVTRSRTSPRRARAPASSRASTCVPVSVCPRHEPSIVTLSVPTASRAAASERASGIVSDVAVSSTAFA